MVFTQTLLVFAAILTLTHQQNITHDELDLKLVHVVFRHGARTPISSYPNDPFKNETFEPYGFGELTNPGKLQMFELGKYLRARYQKFLDPLKLNDIYARSTDMSRTKMSLQLMLAGFFPPKGTSLEWKSGFDWQPIPYVYEKRRDDNLLLVSKLCPRYHEEYQKVQNEEVKAELEEFSEMFAELTNKTGTEINSHAHNQHLHGVFKSQLELGLDIPEWAKRNYLGRMSELMKRGYIYSAYNPTMKKLTGGVFIKKAIEDWEKKIEGKLAQKILFFSAHETSVVGILAAFNVWEQQLPEYGMTAIFELSQHKKTGKFGIQIFYRNSTSSDLYELNIPGCGKFCYLNDLKVVLKENIPEDWKEECKALNPNAPGHKILSFNRDFFNQKT